MIHRDDNSFLINKSTLLFISRQHVAIYILCSYVIIPFFREILYELKHYLYE